MKKSRFTDGRILAILQQAESGVPVADLCRTATPLMPKTGFSHSWRIIHALMCQSVSIAGYCIGHTGHTNVSLQLRKNPY